MCRRTHTHTGFKHVGLKKNTMSWFNKKINIFGKKNKVDKKKVPFSSGTKFSTTYILAIKLVPLPFGSPLSLSSSSTEKERREREREREIERIGNYG